MENLVDHNRDSLGEFAETIHRGNPCYDLQGFPTELTPRVIPCCIVRIFEECGFTLTGQAVQMHLGDTHVLDLMEIVYRLIRNVRKHFIGKMFWNNIVRFMRRE